jgi:nicotinamidase-related amidase
VVIKNTKLRALQTYLVSFPLIAAAAVFIPGCTTSIPGLKEWADPIIGHPIFIISENDNHPGSYAHRIGWVKKTYTLDNGHWVYVHPDRIGCEIHFEVGADGNVIGYRPVGEGCPDK